MVILIHNLGPVEKRGRNQMLEKAVNIFKRSREMKDSSQFVILLIVF
jgi:hypothetical protein